MIPLLTLLQAADTLQVSIRSVRRLVDAGALPAIRIGRLVRIDPADLAALIHTHKAPARVGRSARKRAQTTLDRWPTRG